MMSAMNKIYTLTHTHTHSHSFPLLGIREKGFELKSTIVLNVNVSATRVCLQKRFATCEFRWINYEY